MAYTAHMTQLVLFNVFNGLIIGAFYALMALGLSLILNLSGVINFAHGGFLAIGGYLAYSLIPYVGFWGALVVSPFLVAGIGIMVERVLIRRLYGRDPLYSLLLTFGLAFMIEDGTRFIWGAQSLPYQIPSWLSRPLSYQYFFLTGYRVFMVILVSAGGRRAVPDPQLHAARHSHSRRHARSRDRRRCSASMCACCAISISASAFILPASPACWPPACSDCSRPSAINLIMPSFIAIIVGGLGSLPGTLAGGILIGVVSGVTTVFLPAASEAVMYVMMAAVLIVRPRGLLGEEGRF